MVFVGGSGLVCRITLTVWSVTLCITSSIQCISSGAEISCDGGGSGSIGCATVCTFHSSYCESESEKDEGSSSDSNNSREVMSAVVSAFGCSTCKERIFFVKLSRSLLFVCWFRICFKYFLAFVFISSSGVRVDAC